MGAADWLNVCHVKFLWPVIAGHWGSLTTWVLLIGRNVSVYLLIGTCVLSHVWCCWLIGWLFTMYFLIGQSWTVPKAEVAHWLIVYLLFRDSVIIQSCHNRFTADNIQIVFCSYSRHAVNVQSFVSLNTNHWSFLYCLDSVSCWLQPCMVPPQI